METSPDEYFEISAVARLTGISSALLRMWERRYAVVEPDRSDSKRRRYTRADIQKLSLLKELVDSGQAIGSLADLSLEQLEERRTEVEERTNHASDRSEMEVSGRIAIVGEAVGELCVHLSVEYPNLRLMGNFRSLEELTSALRPNAADILVIEYDTWFAEDLQVLSSSLENLGIPQAIVLHEFAQRDSIEAAASTPVTVLRAPIGVNELRHACLNAAREIRQAKGESKEVSSESPDSAKPERPDLGKIPKKKYSHSDLVKIGGISPTVKCECPQHLARLISSLTAFESYSQQCEDRNEEDARLHAFLHQATAGCRARMEEALTEVLREEGIEL